MKPKTILTVSLFFCVLGAFGARLSAQPAMAAPEKPMDSANPTPSTFWDWEFLAPKKTPVGFYRAVIDAPTPMFTRMELHVTTLLPGMESHPPHHHPQEEVILLTAGRIAAHINGGNETIGPGSMLFFAAHDPHNVKNTGSEPATYYVINFYTRATATVRNQPAHEWEGAELLHSAVIDGEKLKPEVSATGERRAFVNSPSITFAKLEVHTTTVKPGAPASAAHRHPWAQLVVMRQGAMEATVDGKTHLVGPGSIAYIAPNGLQTMRNPGKVPANYFVVSVASEESPELPK